MNKRRKQLSYETLRQQGTKKDFKKFGAEMNFQEQHKKRSMYRGKKFLKMKRQLLEVSFVGNEGSRREEGSNN